MGRFDLAIFDCDRVLIDSEPIANGVLSRQLARVPFERMAELPALLTAQR